MIFADIQGIVTHVRYRIFLPGLPGQVDLPEAIPGREETCMSVLRESFFSADTHRRAAGTESSKPRHAVSSRGFPPFSPGHPANHSAFGTHSSRNSSDSCPAQDLSKIASASVCNH